jgi:hypothetical protein
MNCSSASLLLFVVVFVFDMNDMIDDIPYTVYIIVETEI